MSEKEQKVIRILNWIRRGTPNSKLIARLESETNYVQDMSERGLRSEKNAQMAIRGLPSVSSVRRRGMGAPLVDLDVMLEDPILIHVWVQVKSSQARISDAKARLMKRKGLSSEELSNWLLREKLIFINGRRPTTQIQADFLGQLEQIREYWKRSS